VFNQVATDGVKTLKLVSTDSKQIIFLAILDTQDQGLIMSDIVNNNQYTLYREWSHLSKKQVQEQPLCLHSRQYSAQVFPYILVAYPLLRSAGFTLSNPYLHSKFISQVIGLYKITFVKKLRYLSANVSSTGSLSSIEIWSEEKM